LINQKKRPINPPTLSDIKMGAPFIPLSIELRRWDMYRLS